VEREDRERSGAARRAEKRVAQERRIGLIVQLVIHLVGVALLVYSFVVYHQVAERLTKRVPQVAFLPIALTFGLVYFAIRALVVIRQLRRRP
jgi:hypothetical protein